jgi:hypothetical protein
VRKCVYGDYSSHGGREFYTDVYPEAYSLCYYFAVINDKTANIVAVIPQFFRSEKSEVPRPNWAAGCFFAANNSENSDRGRPRR